MPVNEDLKAKLQEAIDRFDDENISDEDFDDTLDSLKSDADDEE